MKLLNLCQSPDLRLIVGCLLLIKWGCAASAHDWEIYYRQEQVIAAPLKILPNADADLICPEHFRPARISTDIDLSQLGVISFGPDLPDVSRSGRSNWEQRMHVARSATFDMKVDLVGCVFRRYFLPQKGGVVLSGEFDVGRVEDAEFPYSSDRIFGDLRLQYSAHLSTPARGLFPELVETTYNFSEDQVIGQLRFRLPSLKLPLVSDNSVGREARFWSIVLDVQILSQNVAE